MVHDAFSLFTFIVTVALVTTIAVHGTGISKVIAAWFKGLATAINAAQN